MSALGQKQTYALQQVMSALPPIATSIAFFVMSALKASRTREGDGPVHAATFVLAIRPVVSARSLHHRPRALPIGFDD
jgi:hypothetical protein